LFPALYAILDVGPNQSPESAVSLAEALAQAGVRLLQIRAKNLPARDYFQVASRLVQSASPHGLRLIVNDRPDVAALSGAAGVHVGQEDLPVEAARTVCPSPLWVGVSTHNVEQLEAAIQTSADYIAVGPVFPTLSKENPDPVVGLELIRHARAITRKPIVAIGGITVETASDVFAAGADSVAVISDIARAADPAKRAAQYLEIAARAASAAHN
jgi:thiamine-phosphate pyrophosphorylase